MKSVFVSIVVLVANGCSVTDAEQPKRLEHPVLRFEVVAIPGAGIAKLVSGDVEMLDGKDGWVPLHESVPLVDGTQLRLGTQARVLIQLPGINSVELRSYETERWLVLDETAGD